MGLLPAQPLPVVTQMAAPPLQLRRLGRQRLYRRRRAVRFAPEASMCTPHAGRFWAERQEEAAAAILWRMEIIFCLQCPRLWRAMPAALPSSLVSVGDRAAVGARRRTAPLDHVAAVSPLPVDVVPSKNWGVHAKKIENKSHGPREKNGDAIKRFPITSTGTRLSGNDTQAGSAAKYGAASMCFPVWERRARSWRSHRTAVGKATRRPAIHGGMGGVRTNGRAHLGRLPYGRHPRAKGVVKLPKG